MAIGQLTVNVAANTPRANKALQALASGVRIVGREGRESGPGLKVVTTGLKTLASPSVAGATVRSLKLVVGTIQTLDKAGTVVSAARGSLPRMALQLGRIAAIGGGAGTAIAAVGGVAVVGGLVRARHALKGIAEYSERILELQRIADRVGTGTRFTGGLKMAAESVGVGGDLALTSFEKLNVRISEAARGEGEAVKVLNELQLNAQSLLSARPEERFETIVGAMGKIRNEADKLRIAGKLFEEEGRAMVQVVDLGINKIRAFEDEAERLGYAPTRLATKAAEDYTAQVQRARDAWQEVDDKIRRTIGIRVSTVKPWVSETAANVSGWGMQNAWNMTFGAATSLHNEAYGRYQAWRGGEVSDRSKSLIRMASERNRIESEIAKLNQAGDEIQKLQETWGMAKRLGVTAARGAYEYAQKHPYRPRPLITGMEALRQYRTVGGVSRSLGRLLGAGLNQTTLAIPRLTDLIGQKKHPEHGRLAPWSINRLLDPESREGWMALRANLRGGRDQNSEKTAKATSETATATKETAEAVREMLRFFRNLPAPASA